MRNNEFCQIILFKFERVRLGNFKAQPLPKSTSKEKGCKHREDNNKDRQLKGKMEIFVFDQI